MGIDANIEDWELGKAFDMLEDKYMGKLGSSGRHQFHTKVLF